MNRFHLVSFNYVQDDKSGNLCLAKMKVDHLVSFNYVQDDKSGFSTTKLERNRFHLVILSDNLGLAKMKVEESRLTHASNFDRNIRATNMKWRNIPPLKSNYKIISKIKHTML